MVELVTKQESALVVSRPSEGTLADVRPDLAAEAEELASGSLADATKRAHRADWQVFAEWCARHDFEAMPASVETAAGFLTDQAKTKKVATLERYRSTIGKYHRLKGFSSPFVDERVKAIFRGIRRKKGVTQTQKKPMSILLAASVEDIRNKAVVLFGLATSFRGKELCSLDVEDLTFVEAGVLVRLKKSKTDQEGVGREVGVPKLDMPEACPVRAIRSWLDVLGEDSGPLFRGFTRARKPRPGRMTPQTVNAIVKGVAIASGLDAAVYGAHSLRAGYVTEARKAGQDWSTIMAQTGHKRVETVQRYDRGNPQTPFNASKVAEVFKNAVKKKKEAR
jgi:integrase